LDRKLENGKDKERVPVTGRGDNNRNNLWLKA
jgi:hypothetical protein